MHSATQRTPRSIDYLLSVLSPLEVARSTRAYFDSLEPHERDVLIAHSRARLDDDERSYVDIVSDYVTFLEQNRRALRTLDADALRAILLPVIAAEPGDELVAQLRAALPPPSPVRGLRRLAEPLRERAVVARRGVTAVATAIGVVASGVAAAALITVAVHSLPPAAHAQAAPVVAQVQHPAPRRATHVSTHRAAPARVVRVARVAPSPRPAPTARPTARPTTPPATPKPVAVRRVAAVHPVRHAAPVRHRVRQETAASVADASVPEHEPQLVSRARLIVMSYLDSLMRGDASAALGNLGLSASAGTANLTEAPILAGATEFRIVDAHLADAQSASVHVLIDSPQGRYFGNYVVSANGPAVWITQHEVTASSSGAQ